MLAKLFNNISIPSLARAIFFSALFAILSVLWISPAGDSLVMAISDGEILPWGYKLCMVLSVVLVAFGLNTGINIIGFLKQDYQFLVVYTLLVLGMLITGGGSIELILSLSLGALMFYRLLQLVETIDPSYILFDSGVLLALSTLLIPESAFLLLIIWLATFNFGHGGVRTFLMPLMGAAGLYFMVFTFLYWLTDINLLDFMVDRFASLQFGFHLKNTRNAIVYIPFLIVCIPALLETAQIYGKANVKKRQVFTLLMVISVLIILAGTFVKNSPNLWIWLSIPMSALVVNLIHYRKKNWQKDIFYLLLISFLALSILV